MRRAVRWALVVAIVGMGSVFAREPGPKPPDAASMPPPKRALANLPLHFEANNGQADPRVRFISRGRGYTLFLTPDEALMTLRAQPSAVLRMGLAGGNRNPAVEPLDPLPAKTYYVRGNERGPLEGNGTFAKVRYRDVYPGIDLVYYGSERRLEFDLVVAPDADPGRIRLTFTGAEDVALEKNGELALRVAGRDIRLSKPLLYQVVAGERHPVAGAFVRDGASAVRFDVGTYDRSLPLVIDPVIDFAGYLGSFGMEVLGGVKVNSSNEIYVAGGTEAPHAFPNGTTFGPGVSSEEPFRCFISKISPDGSQLLYSMVYLDRAECSSLELNGADFVYTFSRSISTPSGIRAIVENAGVPSVSEIPVPWVSAARGFSDFRVSADGTRLYVIGVCALEDQVALWPLPNGFAVSPETGSCRQSPASSQGNKPLLMVVDNGGSPIYGTFLAGSNDAPGTGADPVGGPSSLALGPNGKVYIVGHTVSQDFPITGDANQDACDTSVGPCSDGYLAVIDTTKSGAASLEYSSYFGGDDLDFPTSIAIDGPDRVVLTTGSQSSNFPGYGLATTGVFITRYDLACGPPCVQTTERVAGFVAPGSIASPRPQMVRFRNGRIGVIGQADDTLPLQNELFSTPPAPGVTKAAVAVFTRDLSITDFVSYLDDSEFGRAQFPRMATDHAENLYVAAVTTEDNLATSGAFQQHPAGSGDVLLLKLSSVFPNAGNNAPVFDLGPDLTLVPTSPAGITRFELSCFRFMTFCSDPDGDALTLTWTGPFGTFVGDFTYVDFPIGSSLLTLTADDGRGGVTTDTVRIIVPAANAPAGASVTVTLTDESILAIVNNARTPITVTFGNVTTPGLVYLRTRVDQNPPAPLQAGSPPMYYEVLADSPFAFTGGAQLCVSTRGMTFASPGAIELHRLNPSTGTWTPLSGQQATSTSICGETAALGTFAILYPPVPETQLTTIVGTGFAPGRIDGDPNGGPDSRDNYNEGGPGNLSAVIPAGPAAVDRTRGHLYFTSYEAVNISGNSFGVSRGVLYRLNLSTGILDRVAGNRVHPFLVDGPGGNNLSDDPIDGGLALNYPLAEPGGVALDPAGNVYFTERISNASNQFCGILKYDIATLRITRVAGLPPGPGTCGYSGDGGLARDAAIGNGYLNWLAADNAGHVFFVDSQYDQATGSFSPARIRRLDAATSLVTTVVGNGTSNMPLHGVEGTQSPLSYVAGLAVDRESHLLFLSGFQLMRVAPGPDNVVNGGPGEVMTQISCCATTQHGYPDFFGDGQAIGSVLPLGSLSSVAPDGSLLMNQLHLARRIVPGHDTVVSGEPDEIISTIAGFEYDTQDPAFGGGTSLAFYNGDRYSTNSSLGLGGVYEDHQGRILLVEGFAGRIRRFGLAPSSASPDVTAAKAIVTSGPFEALLPALDVLNGETVRFRLTAVNAGSGPTTGSITLTDTLPAGLMHVSGHPACSAAGQVVTCVLAGPILPGQELSIDIVTQVGPAVAPQGQTTTLQNQASVATAGDSNASNDLSGPVTLRVTAPPPPNLRALKILDSPRDLNNGDTVRFRLIAINDGSGATIGPITFVDTFPAGLTYVAQGSSSGCSTANQVVQGQTVQVVTCEVAGPIAPGASTTLTLVAQIGSAVAAPGTTVELYNRLSVSTANDSDPFDNESSDWFNVHGGTPPDLAISKDLTGPQTVRNLDAATYRLRVTSIGGPTMGPMSVTDTLDTRLSFNPIGSDPLCQATLATQGIPQIVTCTFTGPLAAGAARDFTIVTIVAADAAPLGQTVTISNVASVSTPYDSSVSNDSSFPVDLLVANPDTTPPVVTPPANITVAAILSDGTHGADPNLPASVAVAAFVNGGSAIDNLDPAPLRLPLVQVDCGNPSVVTNAPDVTAGSILPVGTTCVRFSYQDAAGNIGMASASITVLPPVGGIVSVAGVAVTATDANNVPQPVTVAFNGEVGSGGLVQANPIVPPPAVPAGFVIAGVAYDITATVPMSEVVSITVCFTGSFAPGDTIYHHGSPVPTTLSQGRVCAIVSSLSPFMVLRPVDATDTTPPVLTLPSDTTVEAASPAGTAVTFAATAVDDVDGPLPVTCAPAPGATFALGTTSVNCSTGDAAGNAASGSFRVTVVDTQAPIAIAPPALTVPATEPGGVRPVASPALAAFLAGGTAIDLVDPSPMRLAPRVGGVDVRPFTLFPVGTTVVTFRFRDASGNVARATAAVTVKIGTPKLSAVVTDSGRDGRGSFYVDLRLTNIGTGHARCVLLTSLTFRTLAGSGAVTFDAARSGRLPLEIGSLDVGSEETVRIYLRVPASVRRFSIAEAGVMENVAGARLSFLLGQVVTP